MNSQKVRIQNVFSCLLMRGVAFLSFFFLPTIITLMAFFSNLPIWVVGSCAFFLAPSKKKLFGWQFWGSSELNCVNGNWFRWFGVLNFFLCEVWGQFVLQLLGMVHNSSLASSTVNCNHLLRRSLRPNIWQVGIPKYSNVLLRDTKMDPKWTQKMDS